MCRELRETFQRLDSFAQEVKRKDSKMKELQQRLEAGQGCKLLFWLVCADFLRADLKFISQESFSLLHRVAVSRNLSCVQTFESSVKAFFENVEKINRKWYGQKHQAVAEKWFYCALTLHLEINVCTANY